MRKHTMHDPVRTASGLVVPRGATKQSYIRMLPLLSAIHYRARGGRNAVVRYDELSRKVITTAGVNFLASAFLNTVEPEVLNYHDCGIGTGGEVVGDTALGSAFGGARVAGTQTNPSANIYRTVATISFTSGFAITEHGIFSASTVGTLWDRSVFAAINVVNGDSIQFTYNLTLTAGG